MKNVLEDDSADDQDDDSVDDWLGSPDQFSFDTLNIPDEIPVNLTTKVGGLVDNKTISTQNILDLHAAVTERGADFADILGQVVEIIESSEYYSSFEDLLRLYKEDPLHLLFMNSDNHTGLVSTHSDGSDIVRFGLKHYKDDIDVSWIREQLGGGEEDTAALMDFDLIIGTHDDEPIVSGGNSHEDDPHENDPIIDVAGKNAPSDKWD